MTALHHTGSTARGGRLAACGSPARARARHASAGRTQAAIITCNQCANLVDGHGVPGYGLTQARNAKMKSELRHFCPLARHDDAK